MMTTITSTTPGAAANELIERIDARRERRRGMQLLPAFRPCSLDFRRIAEWSAAMTSHRDRGRGEDFAMTSRRGAIYVGLGAAVALLAGRAPSAAGSAGEINAGVN